MESHGAPSREAGFQAGTWEDGDCDFEETTIIGKSVHYKVEKTFLSTTPI